MYLLEYMIGPSEPEGGGGQGDDQTLASYFAMNIETKPSPSKDLNYYLPHHSPEFQTFRRFCMLQQCSVSFECCNCHPLQCLMQLFDSPSSLPALSPDAIFILYQYELCKIKISFYDFCPTFISM